MSSNRPPSGATRETSALYNILKQLRLWHDRFVDRRLGVDTTCHLEEIPSGTVNDDAEPYLPPAWAHVRLILRELHLKPDDVFVDYGCGAGRILCEAARRGVARVIGVEFSKPLVDAANENIARLKGKNAPCEVSHGDAVDFEPIDCTVAFFFNPFGPKTLNATLDHLEKEADRSGREIRLLYLNAAFKSVFDERDRLTQVRVLKWRPFRHEAYVYTLSSRSGKSPSNDS